MAAKHVMTAKRRAALRKAQLASARKRKKGVKKATRRYTQAQRGVYAAQHYRGPGGLHRNVRDFTRGTGAHGIGRKKPLGTKGRVARRTALGVAYAGYGTPIGVAHGVSYLRHRKSSKKRKKR